jgi:hypothetical protein
MYLLQTDIYRYMQGTSSLRVNGSVALLVGPSSNGLSVGMRGLDHLSSSPNLGGDHYCLDPNMIIKARQILAIIMKATPKRIITEEPPRHHYPR